MRTGLASTMALWGLAACSGGELAPGAGNAAGTGTHTLAVDGSARAAPHQINARLPSDFDTDFTVRVTLGNQTVTTGTVAITSATGKVPLTLRPDGRWRGSAPGYDQVYVLDVATGDDAIEGVRVDGPDTHVFTEPTEGAVVDASAPLRVAWTCSDHATDAMLRADNLDPVAVPDTGEFSLPVGALRTDRSQPRPNTVRLTRTNRVVPAGAIAGSSWTVTVDNAINVVASPR